MSEQELITFKKADLLNVCRCNGGALPSVTATRQSKRRGAPGSKSLASALNDCTDEPLVDFVAQCLHWDPATRLTPPAALQHNWFRRRNDITSSRLSKRPAVAYKKLAVDNFVRTTDENDTTLSKLPQI
jgi:serine/threonine protein kinase